MPFIFNPYRYAGGDIVTIDLADSPAQAVFDLDMTGYDELEMWVEDLDAAGGTTNSPAFEVSTDGGSTYKTSASDYFTGYGYLGSSDTNANVLWTGSGDNSAHINIHAYHRIIGFNQANCGVMFMGHAMLEASASDLVEMITAYSVDTNVNAIRLTPTSKLGSTGKIYYRKVAWDGASSVNNYDWTVDTSLTTFMPVSGYDFTAFRVIDNTPGRFQSQVSDDGTTRETGNIYYDWQTQVASAALPRFIINHSLDDASEKSTVLHIIGPDDGATHRIPYYGGSGHNMYGGRPTFGHVKHTSAVTHWVTSEHDDATSFTGGTVDTLSFNAANRVATSSAFPTSGTELFTLDVDGYDHCTFVMDQSNFMTLDSRVYITFSVDGGSTYLSTGYDYQGNDNARTINGSEWRTGIFAQGATNNWYMEFHGLGPDMFPTMYGSMDWSGATGEAWGFHFGESAQVTHIKAVLATGAVDTAAGYTYHKWNWA